jgi:branched-chain amino acid transport system permease protein
MSYVVLVEQLLNGLQLGVMLFLIAAGLTLVFGIMNFINLAHGSFYMAGAFLAAAFAKWSGSFVIGVVLGLAATVALAAIVELAALRPLYGRDHLDQVLATFSLILIFNELAIMIWGTEPQYIAAPAFVDGAVEILPGVDYPLLRLAITGFGLLLALGLYLLVTHTRVGMLIRAGASNRRMVQGLGVNIGVLFSVTFALGAALAGFAGMITAPLFAVQVGIGEPMLVLAFVVVVIGGIGSIRGAFVGALLVGLVDSLGRFALPLWLGYQVGPAVASMAIYILMAAVLMLRPQGLLAAGRG